MARVFGQAWGASAEASTAFFSRSSGATAKSSPPWRARGHDHDPVVEGHQDAAGLQLVGGTLLGVPDGIGVARHVETLVDVRLVLDALVDPGRDPIHHRVGVVTRQTELLTVWKLLPDSS